MSRSVAEEIQQLFALFQSGALTPEEFADAKAAALRGAGAAACGSSRAERAPLVGGPQPPPQAAPLGSVPPPSLAAADESRRGCFSDGGRGGGGGGSLMTACNVAGFVESSIGTHDQAYQHLKTIAGNILHQPGDPRFRKLRTANPKLAAELFADPGVEPFLQSLGFYAVDASFGPELAQAQLTMPNVSADDGKVFLCPQPPPPQLLREALAALDELSRRDDAARENAKHYDIMRHTIGMAIRRERWAKAMAVGELPQYIEDQLLRKNHPADVAELLALLRTVLTNVLGNPAEPRFRTLRNTNRLVREKLLPSPGALELLVPIAGFELSDQGLVLPGSNGCAAAAATAQVEDERGGEADSHATRGGGSGRREEGVAEALALLDKITATFNAAQAAEREALRAVATAAALEERRATIREDQRLAVLQGGHHHLRGGGTLAPRNNKEEGKGNRVPIAEAFRVLMGLPKPDEEGCNNNDDDDDDEDEEGEGRGRGREEPMRTEEEDEARR